MYGTFAYNSHKITLLDGLDKSTQQIMNRHH